MLTAASDTPEQLSVVITTYGGESAANLRAALNSVIHQTLLPSQMIVVFDGPVPSDQRHVVADVSHTASFPIALIELPVNQGRGIARNVGIEAAPDGFIALMDSDDVCTPTRLEKQMAFLRQAPHVDVLAGWTEEFFEGMGNTNPIVKYCPRDHAAIAASLRWTNCVANPTLIIRRSAWRAVGGFGDDRDINEDYLFFLRLLRTGAVFACLPEVVLKVRISPQQRLRRNGLRVLRSDLRFRYVAWREGHIDFVTTCLATMLITLRRLAPPQADLLLHRVWRRLARNLMGFAR